MAYYRPCTRPRLDQVRETTSLEPQLMQLVQLSGPAGLVELVELVLLVQRVVKSSLVQRAQLVPLAIVIAWRMERPHALSRNGYGSI